MLSPETETVPPLLRPAEALMIGLWLKKMIPPGTTVGKLVLAS
jgi:hypothetical protein